MCQKPGLLRSGDCKRCAKTARPHRETEREASDGLPLRVAMPPAKSLELFSTQAAVGNGPLNRNAPASRQRGVCALACSGGSVTGLPLRKGFRAKRVASDNTTMASCS